jgi:N-hydroxyarylamine O-acetyltransferase
MAHIDIDAYLRRLGIGNSRHPSVTALRALHAAHVERVPYEVIDIQLGRITSIAPDDCVARITGQGRGGYCMHLNGAYSALLGELGYDVRWHRAAVQSRATPLGRACADHLTLTVHGLDSSECPSGIWLADVGLGDGPHGPLPLHEGVYTQGPFRYRLRRSTIVPEGWRFDHDPRGSFAGIDFGLRRARLDSFFIARHIYHSTSPDAPSVRTCVVQRRDASGSDLLTGCVLRRVGAISAPARTLTSQTDWFGSLARVFGLRLADLDDAARVALWSRVRAAHEAWLSTRQEVGSPAGARR